MAYTSRKSQTRNWANGLTALAGQVPDLSRCIFNLHDPPIDSSLDICAVVEEGNPPRHILKGGQPVMHNAGSPAVRKAIETYQPLLSCTGTFTSHRASFASAKRCASIRAARTSEGILRGAILSLKDGKSGRVSVDGGVAEGRPFVTLRASSRRTGQSEEKGKGCGQDSLNLYGTTD